MLSSSSTVIPNSTTPSNRWANSQSCHWSFGYHPSALTLTLPSLINSSGISNSSTPSNLETTVIFKIFDSTIVCLKESLFNESNTFETLIPPSSLISANSIKSTKYKISSEFKISVLLPSSSNW